MKTGTIAAAIFILQISTPLSAPSRAAPGRCFFSRTMPAIFFCPTLIVAPITSRVWKKTEQPTHCRIENLNCLNDSSMVLLEQIRTIDKRRVVRYIGRVSREQMDGVNEAIQISLGLYIPEEMEAP